MMLRALKIRMKIGKGNSVRWTQGVSSFSLEFYPELKSALWYSESFFIEVLSVTILETTKTAICVSLSWNRFYRSQFWRLQKPRKNFSDFGISFIGHNFGDYKNQKVLLKSICRSFIGHNFGDYKNKLFLRLGFISVLSVTILETTKTRVASSSASARFYRSQFWRLQKPLSTLYGGS